MAHPDFSNLPPGLIPGGRGRPLSTASRPQPTTPTSESLPPGSPFSPYRTTSPYRRDPTNSPIDGAHPAPSPSDGAGPYSPANPMDPGAKRRPSGGPTRTKSPGMGSRLCKICGEPLVGQFVRALNGTFHLECFRCRDCGANVASKFFPVDGEDGSGQYPLCERDYFGRLGLLCYKCDGALRGSYITALNRKYHIEHFTCSVCPTVFGAQDSYYEHDGQVYCHYHYSTQFAQRCNGCQTAILKQFVELFRNGAYQHWHPECYMIHKFWNVRLAPGGQEFERPEIDVDVPDEERNRIREEEDRVEERVFRIWSVLSRFEESSAGCISEMLLNVSNGAYVEGVVVAKKFIYHVDILFQAIDGLAAGIARRKTLKELSYSREAKLLCKKIVSFFKMLSKTQESGVRKLGVTQQLLTLVTSLAHYLKLLIRIGLSGALRYERETNSSDQLYGFLNVLEDLDALDSITGVTLMDSVHRLSDHLSDRCAACSSPIDDECIMLGHRRWHLRPPHLVCGACQEDLTQNLDNARWSERNDRPYCRNCAENRGHDPLAVGKFAYVTKLQQYVFLLQVALARLLAVLRSSGSLPHTSDDPNLGSYQADEGQKVSASGEIQGPKRADDARSKSFTEGDEYVNSTHSLAQTVGEIKRLHSTRTERTLSTTFKTARASRVIDGPQGRSARPGSPGAGGDSKNGPDVQIVEERGGDQQGSKLFGVQDKLVLDDIARIAAAEQAKEQRPRSYSQSIIEPSAAPGQARAANGRPGEAGTVAAPALQQQPRGVRYFSELSALEYFIVRHVAVLSMEPMLDGQFNLEELLSLIEPRKQTFWNIFGRAFKNDARKGGRKKGVFGVPLESLAERDGTESTHGVGPGTLRVPTFIDDAVSAMRQMDMSVEGVFRKNGNIKKLKETSDLIDSRYDQVDLNRENPVQAAALLKKFLREMPEPLLTDKLYRLFMASRKVNDMSKQRHLIHLICCLLPKTHRDTMEVLFSFLNWTASFSQVDEESGSKMDTHNLATVIAPSILAPPGKTSGRDEIDIVAILIEYCESMCEVPIDLQSVLTDTSLFNEKTEITTKEILKKYGGIGRLQQAYGLDDTNGSNRVAQSPVTATKVEQTPSQTAANQAQSSVRHVYPTSPSDQSSSHAQGNSRTGSHENHINRSFDQVRDYPQPPPQAYQGGHGRGQYPHYLPQPVQQQQLAFRPRPMPMNEH